MNNEQIDKLKALAERATQGPLEPYDNFIQKEGLDGEREVILAEFFGNNPMWGDNSNDTHYYAAVSPDVVLGLIDELVELRTKCALYEEMLVERITKKVTKVLKGEKK